MSIAVVSELYRYPVKSMMGESLTATPVGEKGFHGDRAWAVRDEERGGIRGAKRFAELMTCHAGYNGAPGAGGASPATITLPDGETLSTGDDAIAGRLSELVGTPVTLWPLMPADAVDHYRRGAPLLDDMEAELRRVFGRLPDEPLPDLSVFPPELMEFESPVGTYFDAFPLLVMTRQSLANLRAAAPDHAWDVRRFRPNILLDADSAEPFPEKAWEGRQLRIGSTTLSVEMPCPRCVMTTHGFDDLPGDPGVMRSLVEQVDGCLGMYASVVQAGEVSVGDEVTLV